MVLLLDKAGLIVEQYVLFGDNAPKPFLSCAQSIMF